MEKIEPKKMTLIEMIEFAGNMSDAAAGRDIVLFKICDEIESIRKDCDKLLQDCDKLLLSFDEHENKKRKESLEIFNEALEKLVKMGDNHD